MAVFEEGEPYRVNAWRDDRPEGEQHGVPFYKTYMVPLLHLVWGVATDYFPRACGEMLTRIRRESRGQFFGLEGTGFTKITLAINNPTNVHCDPNWGITALLVVPVPGETLVWGSHVLFSDDLSSAVVVRDTPLGLLILGDYSRSLHANMMVVRGARFIVNMYCSSELVKVLEKYA